jgi:hypothetical protein
MSTVTAIFSTDQSGATMKFTQISKLISRLRYINVNYGGLFGSFLDGLGENFHKENSSTIQKSFGKLTEEQEK